MRKIPILINLEKEHLVWLKKEAKRRKISVAEVIRQLIDQDLGFIVESDG